MIKELIIKVTNEGVYLSPNLLVPIKQTNIPAQHCKFRTHEDIFWKAELIEYNQETKCWKIKVVDYFTSDIKCFDRQKSTREVHRIAFEKFDWLQFERHLSNYQKIKLLDVLHNHDAERFFREEPKQKKLSDLLIAKASVTPTQKTMEVTSNTIATTVTLPVAERNPIIIKFDIEFSVYFSDAQFMLGYVAFSKNVEEVRTSVDFKIKNDYILPEFDNIKSWFAKKLKRKFKVFATIVTKDGQVTEVTCSSTQIDMIDAELVDSIKRQRTLSIIKPTRLSEIDKSIFTSEEIFGDMESENIEGNVFRQTEQDILSFLLDNHKTRNRKQLEYLSGSKQSANSKLRFTLHPNFGFLFFIEGNENNHFVWELLNSHATYIWSIDKSDIEMELQFKRIEESINTIRDTGREQYKRAYKQNNHDSDLVFCVIDHEDITSNFVDGFVKWRHRLDEKIT
jgi:hypothetical protein